MSAPVKGKLSLDVFVHVEKEHNCKQDTSFNGSEQQHYKHAKARYFSFWGGMLSLTALDGGGPSKNIVHQATCYQNYISQS